METDKTVNVGILGFGTVGTGVIQHLLSERVRRSGVRLKKVAVSNLNKGREVDFGEITSSPREIIEDPAIDIVVELIGGESPARELLLEAIAAGKSVVTANKAVISRYMPEIFEKAREKSVDVAFEASVAGSIPIIRVLQGYTGQPMLRVTGILNGTSNYILSRMEEGTDFETAVQLAQQKGYAEVDHSLDTGGFDARDKLAIMASLVFNFHVAPEAIYCEGITGVTPIDLDFGDKHGVEEGGPGFVVKPLAGARVTEEGLELYVFPALLERHHPLASVRDEVNAVYIEGSLCGPQLYQGRGAGREATTSAVLSDIYRLVSNRRKGVVDELPTLDSRMRLADPDRLERRGYVRMNLKHLPGSIAEAARILGSHGFNIEDSVQRRRFRAEVNGEVFIPDIVTAEPLPFSTVREALADLQSSHRIHGEPFYLRFET